MVKVVFQHCKNMAAILSGRIRIRVFFRERPVPDPWKSEQGGAKSDKGIIVHLAHFCNLQA